MKTTFKPSTCAVVSLRSRSLILCPKTYAVWPLGDESELPARSWLSWKAFHPDEPDEKYEGWEWYRNV